MQETELGEQVAKAVQEKAEEVNQFVEFINGKIPAMFDFDCRSYIFYRFQSDYDYSKTF